MFADTLELKAEKANAHTDTDIIGDAGVTSVGYSPDGTKVVSSGKGGTLKVWNSGAKPPPSNPPPFSLSQPSASLAETLELKTEKKNAHSEFIRSVDFSPDGKTIVSGSDDRTLKVWNAGETAAFPQSPQN